MPHKNINIGIIGLKPREWSMSATSSTRKSRARTEGDQPQQEEQCRSER
jgi:hypothetical protein